MKTYIRAIISAVLIATTSLSIEAAWGDYDTTFGFLGGVVDTSVSNHTPRAVALQTDGKILVTGYRLVGGKKRFFLRRYLSNGQVDTSFGSNGSAISNALINVNADYYGEKMLVQDNGRIVVSGMGNGSPTIWRFYSSGSADTSMGGGGMRSMPAFESITPRIATYANILYIGVMDEVTDEVFVIKLNSNGTQDTTFGSGGEALTGMDYRSYSIVTEPGTGNILVGGRQTYPALGYGVIRFLTTGVLDSTFTSFGATYAGFVGYFPDQFVRLANGQFVMNERWINIAQGGGVIDSNLVRLTTNGAFAARVDYGPGGWASDFSGSCPDLMVQQSDGRVVTRGILPDKLYRFSTNFSSIESMSCANYASLGSRTPAVIQSDDKMLAAGTSAGGIAMVRTMP